MKNLWGTRRPSVKGQLPAFPSEYVRTGWGRVPQVYKFGQVLGEEEIPYVSKGEGWGSSSEQV